MIKLKTGIEIPENAIQLRTTAAIDSYYISEPLRVVQYDQTLPVAAVQLIYQHQSYIIPQSAELNVRMQKPDGKGVYNPCLGSDENGVVYFAFTQQMTAVPGNGKVQSAELNVRMQKPDGKGVYNPCLGSDENGVVYFAFTQQMTAVPGNGKVTIEVTAGGVKNSAPIAVNVAANPVQQDKIESADEFLTLQEILAEAQKWGKIVQDNAANIQQAVDNMDAIKGAPDAANRAEQAATNAEKYAAMAQQVSQGAVGFYQTESALKQAHPTGVDGNWAIVGDTDSIWVWDGDSRAWLDTKTNIKLSDYYTKTESDSRYLGKQDKAQSAAVADSAATATNAQQLNGHTWDDIKPRAVTAEIDATDAIGKQDKAQSAAVADSAATATNAQQLNGHTWDDIKPRAVTAEIDATDAMPMPTDVVKVPLKISVQSANAGFTISDGTLVMPKSGTVVVAMQAMFTGAANTYMGMRLSRNTTSVADYYEAFANLDFGCIASVPTVITVNANDKLTFYAARDSEATGAKIANSPRTKIFVQYV